MRIQYKFKFYLDIVTLILIFGISTAGAVPVIESIDTSRYAQEGVIVLTGSDFGPPASIQVLDDFEHVGAATGGAVSLDQARLGNWTETSLPAPLYDNFAYSGNFSILGWNSQGDRVRQITKIFDVPIQSVFLSYWVAIPPGFPFPGNDASIAGGFSTDSSWKFLWLIDEDVQGNSSDLTVPTYTGQGSAQIAGNDLSLGQIAKPINWWSWGNWMRISAWLRADPNAPTENGRVLFQIFSKEFGTYVFDRNIPVFDNDGPTEKQYQRINFPGWIRTFAIGEGRPVYDDIYVASGPNAFARVELTDNIDYRKSFEFAIQAPTSWSDTQIEIKIISSAISDIDKAALHIFNAGGKRSIRGKYVFAIAPDAPNSLITD